MKRLLRGVGVCLAGLVLFALPATASETITYTYDALGRLVTSASAGTVNNGQNVSTTYDAAGNRTNQTVSGVGGGGTQANLAIGNASVTEGGTLSFTVTRSGNTSIAASAHYATTGGTATSGTDFTAASGTVSFAASQTTATITVNTTDDSTVESPETMTVTLSSPSSGATITGATGTGTINDNDSGGGGGSGCGAVTAIVPLSYSASSTWSAYAYTGLSGTGAGMRDGVYDTLASMHGTNSGTDQWVMMNLGSAQAVGNVIVADALASAPGSWGAAYTNGAVLEKSSNGSTWTSVATVSGAADNVPVTIAVNDTVQYLRLRMPSGYLGVGDFCATAGSGGGSAQLSIGNASATEGAPLSFTVTRSGNTSIAASAHYATTGGTATSGTDFTAASGTVSFAASQATATITVNTTDDSTVESPETMTVTLSSPSSGATITGATGTGTINDNDSGGGGGSGCGAVTAIVPLSYSASSSYSTFAYTGLSGTGAGMRDGVYDTLASMHGTAYGTDQWVMMNLGSAQAVGNVIVADALISAPGSWGPGDFNGAVLEKSSNGSTWTSVATVSGAADNVPVTIAVNDTVQYLRLRMPSGYLGVGDFCATAGSGGGSAQLSIGNASATEGAPLSFTVTRSGNTSIAASAHYATTGGTATSGTDFTAASGTVSFAASQATATITVNTTDDSTVESPETMTVTLSSPSIGATITGATGTGTINDNDTPAVAFSIADASASEGDALNFMVGIGAHSGTVSVTATTSNGTATAPGDYTTKSQTLTFTSAQTSQTFSVATTEDSISESTETMNVTLSGASSGTTIADGTAVGTITDDDGAWSASLTTGTGTSCGGYCGIVGFEAGWLGSLSNTAFNGYTITGIYTTVYNGGSYVTLSLSGSSVPPNSGWTSITIAGVGTLSRASATYTAGTNAATWTWVNSGYVYVANGTVTIQ